MTETRAALRRIVLAYLSCVAGVASRALPDGEVADIELVLPGGRIAYIDVLPGAGPVCARRSRLAALGVTFAPIRSVVEARYALEDLGVLDPLSA